MVTGNWFDQQGGLAGLKSGLAHTRGAGWQVFSTSHQNEQSENQATQ